MEDMVFIYGGTVFAALLVGLFIGYIMTRLRDSSYMKVVNHLDVIIQNKDEEIDDLRIKLVGRAHKDEALTFQMNQYDDFQPIRERTTRPARSDEVEANIYEGQIK